MQEKEIEYFLRHLGVDPRSFVIDPGRGWFRSSCPFAPWLHEKGTDSSQSFGITISDDVDKPSVGKCFACMSDVGAKVPPMLLQMFWYFTKKYPLGAARVLAQCSDNFDIPLDGLCDGFDTDADIVSLQETSKSFQTVLSVFRELSDAKVPGFRDVVQEYLLFRNVPIDIQRKYGVRYSIWDGMIGFPLTDDHGAIHHIRFRKPYTKYIRTLSKWYFEDHVGYSDIEFPRIVDTGALFGMHLVKKNLPIYVVEGEIDAMVWHSLGFDNVVASATTSVTEAHFARLFAATNTLILGFDADKAGSIITKKAVAYAKRAGCFVYYIDWAQAGVKDAGALVDKEQVALVKKTIKRLTIK